MNIHGYTGLFAALVIVLVCAAGCTTPQIPGAGSPAPSATPALTAPPQNPVSTPASTASARTANIDTTVNVRFNDVGCLDVQKEMGVSYLYPDQKYRLTAASPNAAAVNVNVLFVDENDSLGLREIKPAWNSVQKTWEYEGIVPVVQFNDITVSQEKTFTIKTQSKYYICADDRKETGTNDIMLRVPVTLTRLA